MNPRNANAPTRWCCTCAYDGGAFAGWQSQPNGLAIQDVIENRIRTIFGEAIRVHASGRTDAGVHARAQIFHFDAAWPHGAEKLRLALRVGLPQGLQIARVEAVGAGFHARFSATGKEYHYHLHLGDADPFTRPYVWVYERPLDLAAMDAAAKVLEGRHDFRAFAALNGAPRASTVRDLRRLALHRRGPLLRIEAEADGFLYKMVRSLVGALVAVGEGKLPVEQVRALLEGRDRPAVVFTAPPQGLFLERVQYPRGAKKKRASEGASMEEPEWTD